MYKKLVQRLRAKLNKTKFQLVVAESCTGGLLTSTITEFAGSSTYFERGFIVYSNLAKQELLGVKAATLKKFGAVSEKTAHEMAQGALHMSHAQVSVAITGIAGPSGGTRHKPKGTVCMAFIVPNVKSLTTTQHFSSGRHTVRTTTVKYVLEKLLALLS